MEMNRVYLFSNNTDESPTDSYSMRIILQTLGRSVKELQTQYFQNGMSITPTSNDLNEFELAPLPLNETDLDCGLTTLLITFSILLLLTFIGCRVGFCYISRQERKRSQLAKTKALTATFENYPLDTKIDYVIKPV